MKILRNFLMIILSISILMLSIQSCEKIDQCENVVCQNGGSCSGNVAICDCPPGFTGDLCETALTIQQRLENETPFQIYQSDNSLLEELYGKIYEGGYIFHFDPSSRNGMVAAFDDLGVYDWGCNGTDIDDIPNVNSVLAGDYGSGIGFGNINTGRMSYLDCAIGSAAMACFEYRGGDFDNWFLPSSEELNLMWERLADTDGDGENLGIGDSYNIGGFQREFYWSSTENNANNAWNQQFYDSPASVNQFQTSKSSQSLVRPARYFFN